MSASKLAHAGNQPATTNRKESAMTDATETPTSSKAKRGNLPEGYVTPSGLAKELTARELHTTRDGSHEVKPQMVYSYIRNATKENAADPFPVEMVEDDKGNERQAVQTEEAIAWWTRKNERVQQRRENAQAKKASASSKKSDSNEADLDLDPSEEAE